MRLVAVVTNILKLRDTQILHAMDYLVLDVEANSMLRHNIISKLMRAGETETLLIRVRPQIYRLHSLDQWLNNRDIERNALCILHGRRKRSRSRSKVPV